MKKTKWFWGLIILTAGVLLVLSALGVGQEIGLLRVLGSALLVGISIESLVRARFFLFPLPLALTAYLWRNELGFTEINLTLLLVAAVVVGIGLSILFRKKTHSEFKFHKEASWKNVGEASGPSGQQQVMSANEQVNIEANFSEQIKYVHADNLKKANISSNFAETVVYFDQCQVAEEGLVIHVSGNFTEIVLHVPSAWKLENQISVFAATVNGVDRMPPGGVTKVLLNGSINFGEVKIVPI